MWQDERGWPRPELRAGNEDRTQVIAELQRHYVEGRLTADELGERVTQASAAKTFGELASTVSDLPAAAHAPMRPRRAWEGGLFGLPIEAVLAAVAVLALLVVLVLPGLHMGMFPMGPLFIWGFFFFGRPGRWRRYH
ncbi:MAG: DUF1707 domain-containing protein [Chloroflexi bacterium]|nr:DUF1707 domain-containing protein [Chloroflexota bacterium]